LYKRSLAIREKVLGPEHPNVASSLNNLADLCRAQGRHADAEFFYKRSHAIGEKAPDQLVVRGVSGGLNADDPACNPC
jgi:hypothetical protein